MQTKQNEQIKVKTPTRKTDVCGTPQIQKQDSKEKSEDAPKPSGPPVPEMERDPTAYIRQRPRCRCAKSAQSGE